MRSLTTRKGEIARCRVLARACERGHLASIPVLDHDYDLILDIDQKLWRVQVKYVGGGPSKTEGSVFLDLRRTTRNGKVLVYSKKMIDAIIVYLPKTEQVLWLPPKLWHNKSSITLRYAEARSGRKLGIHSVDDYLW